MTEPRTAMALARGEISAALSAMIARMDQVDAACGTAFPLYSPGAEDRWIVSAGGSWTGGFWGGSWWLRARLTGSSADRRKAREICLRLSPKIASDTLLRSMIFWYGAALGDLWFRDEAGRELAARAAEALAAAFEPSLGCIALGTDLGGGPEGPRRISVDPLAPTIDLLGCPGYGESDTLARQQLETTLGACCTGGGAFHPEAIHENGRFRPIDRAGRWSRGQAWALLGLAKAAARWGDPFIEPARSACDYWSTSRPEPLPPSRADDPSSPCDPSAAVIAAIAMLTLAPLVPADGDRWARSARERIAAVVHSPYFAGLSNKGNGAAPGLFSGACYRTRPGREELVESAWGSFFLMAALCILAGVIEPRDC